MPSKRHRPRLHWALTFLLGLVVIAFSLTIRASAPQTLRTPLPVMTAKPPVATASAAPERTATPAPSDTPAPTATPAPTPVPQSTPLFLGEADAGVWFVDVTALPATAPPAATQPGAPQSTQPIAFINEEPGDEGPVELPLAPDTATETPATDPPATPSPRPGPTPTYEYADEELRIEIIRHEEQNLVYFAAEIWLTDARQLRSAFSSDVFDGPTEHVSDIAERNGAILAINGDFATFNNGGIIIRNGNVYRTNGSTRQLLVIDQNGDFIPYVDPPENPEEAAAAFHEQGVLHTLVFGPVLVDQGQPVPLPKDFFVNTGKTNEPRTAIAQLGPLHYLFLVVDGRQPGYSRGASLGYLQQMLLDMGAITAFNLDGGGSSTICFHGNVLNKPGNGSERRVPDILYIGQ